MIKTTEYEISVPEETPGTDEALKVLIEGNYHLFEESVMSNFRYDTRYSYFGESFKVIELEVDSLDNGVLNGGSFTFEVQIQYYEGCKNKDDVETVDETIEFSYEPSSRLIKFTLDETQWDLDN